MEAEEKLATTPLLLKTPGCYLQQSPWLSLANTQMERLARCMGEPRLAPVARARLDIRPDKPTDQVTLIKFTAVYTCHLPGCDN